MVIRHGVMGREVRLGARLLPAAVAALAALTIGNAVAAGAERSAAIGWTVAATVEGSQRAYRIRVDDPITAVTADYIERALVVAEDAGAAAFLIELDTPGGDLTSTQRIIQALLNAQVPTVVWVGPQGAQAASAGTFIVLAAHAAGMAPRTVIGAASPVGPGGVDLPDTASRKVTEDMSATARSLAERRGVKAARWAERAVRDAVSAVAAEALEMGLIDAVAGTPAELLDAVDGMEADVGGRVTQLATAHAELTDVGMTAAEGLLTRLVHPAVALLLLTIGANAILIELSSPGSFIPGTIGVLALALGFYSLGVLDANLIGLVFLGAAFAMFMLDIKAPTHGLLTAAGIALFVVGSVILFSGGVYEVPWGTIGALAFGSGLFFAIVVSAAIRAMRRQPTTGREGLVGKRAVVRRTLEPDGIVFVQGELWAARYEGAGAVAAGKAVRVIGQRGHMLVVGPAQEGAGSAPSLAGKPG